MSPNSDSYDELRVSMTTDVVAFSVYFAVSFAAFTSEMNVRMAASLDDRVNFWPGNACWDSV